MGTLKEKQVDLEAKIQWVIQDGGEGILNDEGVDEKVCASMAEEILECVLHHLDVNEFTALKAALHFDQYGKFVPKRLTAIPPIKRWRFEEADKDNLEENESIQELMRADWYEDDKYHALWVADAVVQALPQALQEVFEDQEVLNDLATDYPTMMLVQPVLHRYDVDVDSESEEVVIFYHA